MNWSSEYVARHAPLSLSWLEKPYGEINGTREALESRGLGCFDDGKERIVIAPLEDASVCIWRIASETPPPNPSDGRIVARSQSGLLSTKDSNSGKPHHFTSRDKSTGPQTVECTSVDKARNKAYFAIDTSLNEVDLETLQVSSCQQYPFSITAISEVNNAAPLTVGTTLSLHLHDPRVGENGKRSPYAHLKESMDTVPNSADLRGRNDFRRIQTGDSALILDYATFQQPLPLSIVHTSTSPTIHVAGRFPSILQYDRRSFPKLSSTTYSGGSLCSLTSFPTAKGPTLVGAGEYHTKGSLELYPPGGVREPTRNRVSASSSKLLSIVGHGTRLLFSDSNGQLKWMERDGLTLVRRWNINSYTYSTIDLTPALGIFNNDLTEGEVARKLLPVSEKECSDILLWTGEKIGLLSFGKKERFVWNEDVDAKTSDKKENEEKEYGRMMRKALEGQADEVRWVKGLGLGL